MVWEAPHAWQQACSASPRNGRNLFLVHNKLAGKRFVCWEPISGCRTKCCPAAARGGDRRHRSSSAGPHTGRQSPSSACPSVLCKVESGENLSEFPTLRGLPVWLGEIWVCFKQSGIKPGPPGWSWASYPVTHSTEQAPELPPLGCFANLAF